MEYKNGYIDLEKITNKKFLKNVSNHYEIIIDDKLYYMKPTDLANLYNELIAKEIADLYGVSCAKYDIVYYNEKHYLISENAIENKKISWTMDEILSRVYNSGDTPLYNNLVDIKNAFYILFPQYAEKLSEELNNIFIFDAIIANPDRNISNLVLIIDDEKNDAYFAPLFDHQNMLTDEDTYLCLNYTLKSSREEYPNSEKNHLKEFLEMNPEMVEVLKAKKDLIKKDNINEIISKINEKIKFEIPDTIQERILDRLNYNLNAIDSTIKTLENEKVR